MRRKTYAAGAWTFLVMSLLPNAFTAAPAYDFDRRQLESALTDLKNWLPGEWNSFPQVWYERNVTLPAEGEHEHWHRSFALIDAPQVGHTVFYGQVNLGGPDGPILARSQVLYKATIDDDAGVISINGQPIAEPEKFADLHQRPELWGKARMPNEAAINCSFIWRPHAQQLVGVLDAKDPKGRAHGPGTCSYIARNGQEFIADAEWVLSPEELWLYDSNSIGGVQFVGRKDRTHLKLYRTARYTCDVATPADEKKLVAHDRGFTADVPLENGKTLTAMLLRAWYPSTGAGLTDELRLTLTDTDGNAIANAVAPPLAAQINVTADEATINCALD